MSGKSIENYDGHTGFSEDSPMIFFLPEYLVPGYVWREMTKGHLTFT